MASPTLPCFHATSLRQNFERQISLARSQRVLSQTQADRFNTLCQNPWPASPELSIQRLACAALEGNPEFADALLIIEPGLKSTEVFLCLPLCAIERFSSRQRCDKALRRRYGVDVSDNTEVQEQPLPTSIFEYWMDNLMSREEGFLQALDSDLLNTPSLQTVLQATLQATLAEQVPHQPSDPDLWCYQVTQRAAPNAVTCTRPLIEVAMDEFCAVTQPSDDELKLLAPDGKALPAATALALNNALRSAAVVLASPYDRALTRYWQQDIAPGTSRQQHAAAVLTHGYYLALMQLQASGEAPAQEIEWLRKGLRADLGAANGLLTISRVALASGQRGGITLAATLVLNDQFPARSPYYLFTPRHGLVRFTELAAMHGWITSDAQRAWREEAVGAEKLRPLQAMKTLEVRLEPLPQEPFRACADSILAVQRENLTAAMLKRAKVPDEVAVTLDDALDVRTLLAPKLCLLDLSPRWATAEAETVTLEPEANRPLANNGYGRMLELQAGLELIRDALPSLETCLRNLLGLRLSLLDDSHLNATSVWVERTTANGEKARDTLLVLALEHLARTAPEPLTAADGISGVDKTSLPNLDHHLLNRWLPAAARQAKGEWIAQFHRFNQQPTRLGNYQMDAHRQSLSIRQQALREELALQRQVPANDVWAQRWLQQLLERPRRAMRLALGDAAVECNSIHVQLPGQDFELPMSNVIALTQSIAPDGLILFCSHRHGLMSFDDHAAFSAQLNRMLDIPTGREQWLKLFAGRYQPQLRAHLETADHAPLRFSLNPSEQDYAQLLQRGEETRQIFTAEAAFIRARKGDYPASLWLPYVDDAAGDLRLGDQLDELTQTLKGAVLDKALPAWLQQATPADLDLYSQNLLRIRASMAMPQRFLFGVDTATEFASKQVEACLVLDFPQTSVDIANIRVGVKEKFKSSVHFSGATEGLGVGSDGIAFRTLELSLVQYTLHRFIAQPGLPIEVRTADGTALLDGLDPPYVADLARQLDTGGHYLRYLKQLFSATDKNYAKRRKLFREQIPAAMMDVAIEAKLKKSLTVEQYHVIETLLDMPDPLARQMPEGCTYSMRPLCLQADPGLAADAVSGVYLLGANPGTPGPVVLLATYHVPFVFRGFSNQDDLLQQLRKPGELQALVLQRIAPAVHSRYANGGLLTPHFEISAGPDNLQPEPKPRTTQLAFQPVTGNTMDYLFEHSLAFLRRLARAQVVTSEQADHAATLRLLTLLGETGLSLLNGRIALALSAWQTEQWFEASAASAASREWGQAISEFVAALATVLSHRRPRRERLAESTTLVAQSSTPQFSWRANSVPENLKALLRGFEARDIVLDTRQLDAATGLYTAPHTQRTYAPVNGHVYELQQQGVQWHICEGRRQGPDVRRNSNGQWELDIRWGLRGGGAGWSQQRTERARQRTIDREFITEAQGMPEIRRFDLDKALKIGAARLHAKHYLERSLEVLSPPPGQPLSVPALDTLQKFFDVTAPSPTLVGAIKRQIGQIFGELMDASLNLHSSPRYVIGMNTQGREQVLAFVDSNDPLRRIFLTDKFFSLPEQLQAALRASQKGFDVGNHFRATTLIHELSHVANLSVDIAYVEASAPFLELIDGTIGGSGRNSLLHDLKLYRQNTLTAKTPPEQLFKELINGEWRDIDRNDGDGYEHVLRITGTQSLAAARIRFLGDADIRSQVMLANADSVALLITLLARHPLPQSPGG